MDKKKTTNTALVISGAGIKSISVLPLLEQISKQNINIDSIYCCGSGAIVTCLYYMGTPIKEIPEILLSIIDKDLIFAKKNLSSFYNFLPFYKFKKHQTSDAIYMNKQIMDKYHSIFQNTTLESLTQSITIQTTNLETAEGFTIKEGPLAESLYASAALYPALPPIRLHDRWLVGGLYSDHLPLLTAIKDNHYDVVICVDFESNRTLPENNFTNFYSNLIHRVMNVGQKNNQTIAFLLSESTEFIFMKIQFLMTIPHSSSSHIPYIFSRGKKYCTENMPNILNAVKPPR